MLLRHEQMKICCNRLGTQLPHHQRDLTAMISRVIDDVLHQVPQHDLSVAEGELLLQSVIGQPAEEFNQLSLDLRPHGTDRINIRERLWCKQRISFRSEL